MSKARYICKDCKYIWRTKKDVGRPSNCPRCNSKIIVFDNLMNNEIGFVIGITGLILFIWSKINPEMISRVYGNLAGLIGIPLLIIVILITLDQHRKNKRILKQFQFKIFN